MSETRNNAPRRKGPPMGGGMVGGEKPKNFKSTLKKLVSYIGIYKIPIIVVMILAAIATVFAVIGPKIMAKATNALFDGLMLKIAGTGGIDFGYIGKILLFTLGLYIFRMDNERYIAKDLIPYEKGYIRKNRPYAHELFREPNLRRSSFKNHKRRRYTRYDSQPERYPNNHIDSNSDRNSCNDALNISAYDAYFAYHSSGLGDSPVICNKKIAASFQNSAGISRTHQRSDRRNLRRSHRYSGIQQRGRNC